MQFKRTSKNQEVMSIFVYFHTLGQFFYVNIYLSKLRRRWDHPELVYIRHRNSTSRRHRMWTSL